MEDEIIALHRKFRHLVVLLQEEIDAAPGKV